MQDVSLQLFPPYLASNPLIDVNGTTCERKIPIVYGRQIWPRFLLDSRCAGLKSCKCLCDVGIIEIWSRKYSSRQALVESRDQSIMRSPLACLVLLLVFMGLHAFTPIVRFSRSASSCQLQAENGFFKGVKDFFQELDYFVDDAMSRRLGNGANFYGKRKSSFYGKNDPMRKRDAEEFDASEDYQAPSQGGYFQWMADDEGDMRPVTRMKKKIVERKTARQDRPSE